MKSGFDRIGRTVTVEHAVRSCLDKRSFLSRNEARDAARRRSKDPTIPRLYWYRCTLCGGFHLTSKVPQGLRGKDHGKARRQKPDPKQSNRRPEEG